MHFIEDLSGHIEFSDIVKERGPSQIDEHLITQAEPFAERDREPTDVQTMQIGVLIMLTNFAKGLHFGLVLLKLADKNGADLLDDFCVHLKNLSTRRAADGQSLSLAFFKKSEVS